MMPMSQTYNYSELFYLLENGDDSDIESFFWDEEEIHSANPSALTISNVLNYSKVLFLKKSDQTKGDIEIVLN
jgi:hypothetical protein